MNLFILKQYPVKQISNSCCFFAIGLTGIYVAQHGSSAKPITAVHGSIVTHTYSKVFKKTKFQFYNNKFWLNTNLHYFSKVIHITKAISMECKACLNLKLIFKCVVMCSSVMNPCHLRKHSTDTSLL